MEISDKEIRCTVTVKATIDEVWQAWTARQGNATFFAPDSNIVLEPGGAYQILFFPENAAGQRGAEGTQVLSFLPKRMLSFNWDAPPQLPTARANMKTIVVVLITPISATETMVELINHQYLVGGEYDEAFKYFSEAWPRVMKRLKIRFDKGHGS